MNETATSQGTVSRVWRLAGGSAARQGCFPETVTPPLRLRRTIHVHASVKTSVVFDGSGTAFVADLAGGLRAFRADGSLRWHADLRAGMSATPAVAADDTRVFAATHAGWVYALDAQSGEILWTHAVPTQSDPRILSDLLYEPRSQTLVLSSWGGRWLRLASVTGELLGTWEAGIYPQSAAASDPQGRLYLLRAVRDTGIEFVRVDRQNHETLIHREPETPRGAGRALVAAAPVVDPVARVVTCVLNRDRESVLQRWSLDAGETQWRCTLPAAVQATPAQRADGTLLVADLAGTLHAVDAEGRHRWRYASGCEYLLASAVADRTGLCWLGDPLGQWHRIQPDGTGDVLLVNPRSIEAQASVSPAGEMFLPVADGQIHVLGSIPPAG
jgi:outer membrane protein assembly factor BamB